MLFILVIPQSLAGCIPSVIHARFKHLELDGLSFQSTRHFKSSSSFQRHLFLMFPLSGGLDKPLERRFRY